MDFQFPGGLSGKVVETLERGLPATVRYEIELWRSRASWFDKLEESRLIEYQVHYDIIDRRYESHNDGEIRRYGTVEQLENAILRQAGVRLSPLSRLKGRSSYFFNITAKVIPVELEQVREMEAWLEGKIPGEEEDNGGGPEAILGMPERLFGFVASLAGFGDEEIKARSVSFVPEALE